MGLMNERGLKSAAAFEEALRDPERYGVTDQYVLGYAGALYDAEIIGERELMAYVKAASSPLIEKLFGGDDD